MDRPRCPQVLAGMQIEKNNNFLIANTPNGVYCYNQNTQPKPSAPMLPTKVVICEDHGITADGLRLLISYQPQFTVVGQVKNSTDLFALLSESPADILLLDLNLGAEDGFTILTKAKENYPSLRVIVLTMYDDLELVEKAKRAKANGYLLKNVGGQELLRVLENVPTTNFYQSPTLATRAKSAWLPADGFTEKMRLTNRETEIVKLLAQGKDPETISALLFLSLETVRTHKKNIMKKLGVSNTAELVRFAYENMLT